MTELHKKINVKELHNLEDNKRFYLNEINLKGKNMNEECINSLHNLVKCCDETLQPIKKEWEERLDFWSNALNKYYKIKFQSNAEMRKEIYIYPYHFIKSNETLWGVINYNNTYNSGLKDGNITFDNFYKYDYEITEITKEEFLLNVYKNIEIPLMIRLEKIKNGKTQYIIKTI